LREEGAHGVRDFSEVVKWLEKSAAQCNRHALNSLGRLHFYGRGVSYDVFKAQFYFLKSIALGNPLAAYNLGMMLTRDGHPLSGWSLYGKDWLSVASTHGTPMIRQRARNVLVALNRETEKSRRARDEASRRWAGNGAPPDGDWGVSRCRFMDPSSCPDQLWGATIIMGIK
jgi:TPR repeat protein